MLAVTTFPTSSIADLAVTHVGQLAGTCYVFVYHMLLQASGGANDINGADGLGYQQTYQRAGGVIVPLLANAQKGDILQLSPFPGSWLGMGRQHTAIILSSPATPGWQVVDSNWVIQNTVRIHAGTDVINQAHAYNLTVNVWQFGTPSPPEITPPLAHAGTVDGDGKADLVAVNDTSTWVMHSTGTGFSAPQQWSSTAFYGTKATLVADVNGDGKADLVAVNDTSTWVMHTTGTGFSAPQQWSSTAFYGTKATLVADVNGDGKADLVAVNDTSTWVMHTTGTGFSAPLQWSNQPFYGTK
jgi:hypothetical protein